MLFVLFALWAIAAIIWISEPRSPVNRWLGAFSFSGGTGALAAVLDMYWLPQAVQAGASPGMQSLLYEMQAASSLFSYYGIPYFLLMFGLSYSGLPIPRKIRLALPVLLLLPVVLCLFLTPYYNTMYPISYKVVVWWAVPYILVSTVLVLAKRVPPSIYARTHWIVCFAVLPPALFVMFMNYILPSMGMLRMWVYNTWIVSLAAAVFVIGLFTYGFMGMRILIDRRRYDSTLRAVTSGTAMLNHAIKNDVGKLRLFGEKMKRHAVATSQEELLKDAEAVLAASRHMEEMIKRVHRKTEDLELKPETSDLTALIAETLELLKPAARSAIVESSLEEGWTCVVDRDQLAEAFSNLVLNAFEAMEGREGAKLRVTLESTKRELLIQVADNGPGLSRKQRMNVFEPFFTTKRGGGNFGLGLSYSYHVARKHKGSLYVRSRPGEGAIFSISLPKRGIQAIRN
ncbi:sensor histidine kinase [Paenibacillus sp. CAU 1782]